MPILRPAKVAEFDLRAPRGGGAIIQISAGVVILGG